MKRKICIFCEIWESGGIESVICGALSHMDLSGLSVDIVAAKLGESVFRAPLEAKGVRFIPLSGSTRRVAANHRMFRNILRREKYDVLHMNIYHALSLYYARIASELGVPVRIAHAHTSGLRKSPTLALKLLINNVSRKRFTRYATALWACSEASAGFIFDGKALRERGYEFIPNGVELDRFAFDPAARERVRAELDLEGRFIIGNVGRLCRQKNQEFLIDVFAELAQRSPESVLLLVGADENRKSFLERRAAGYGLLDRVVFYGLSDRVSELLQAMDVFVFPSLFEGLGLAPIEAQASGLPVVCSDGEPREVAITEDIEFHSLGEPLSAWADAIMQHRGAERHEARYVEQRMDFDVENTAGIFYRAYTAKGEAEDD